MKTVFTSVFQDEAIVVRSMLESAGIESELLVDSMLDVNPFYYVDVKGASVVVADENEEDAKAIVKDFLEKKKENPET